MMVSFYRPAGRRHRIVIEEHAFLPTNMPLIRRFGFMDTSPRSRSRRWLEKTSWRTLLQREGESIALVLMGGINYSSGRAFDIERVTRAGPRHGCIVGFDLAHAAGNLVLKLHEWDVDFAAWCTYKYLNGGPGIIAGCFVHERHAQDEICRGLPAGGAIGRRRAFAWAPIFARRPARKVGR